ncbi:hypothetical protein SAMN05421594_1491 [Chryseobacterium oleae]|uniref:YD repeat-containing protein n=1 Tax=Chryseobacterium oleae TaxID=491207 RepID=A0A1I4X500_CHROL|nr:hypothetical protein [Chryseobacterium oleae]SFN21108.1 hypothetical protein SAMN05421594_1491 [Chryseobacterium oleae]
MKKILCLLTFLSVCIHAQNNIQKSLPDIKPPSAETYKFSVYGLDFNNSPSGDFSYNFPIYTVGNSINLPVNLSYNSGVKVDDIGGNIGVSWQLVAGGAISRVVRDEQDETSSAEWFPQTIDETANANQIKGAAHPDNSIDTEYDWFSFSLSNGLSGQFYIDKSLNIHYNGGDGSKLSITDKTTMVTQFGKNLEFVLIDNQGNKYYFGGEEKFMERTKIDYKGPDKYYTSGWYLAKVITNKNEIINFDYSIESISYYASMSASFSVSESCCVPNTYENSGITKSKTTMVSLKPRLLSINDDKARINFIYDKTRKDLINGDGRLLTSVTILAKQNNQPIKNYSLNYDDVNAGSAVTYYDLSPSEQSTVNRHFLKNIQDAVSNEKFRFEYYSKENIPARFSLATDFYGYSNGKYNQTPFANVSGKIPNHIFSKTNGYASANKEVEPESTYFGNLKRIYYPTGGYSEVTYESNSSMETVQVEKFEGMGLQASRACVGPRTVSKKFTFVSNGSPITYAATASTNYLDCGQPDFHEVHGISIRDLTDPAVPVNSSSGSYNVGLNTNNCYTGLPHDTCPVNTIAGHTYEVEYSVTSYFGRIDGFASVNYNSRYEMEDVLKHYGGSRVKKIEENNTEGGSYTRLFYYNKLAERTSPKKSIANAGTPKLFDYIMTKRNCALECNSSGSGNPIISSTSIPAYRFYKDNILTDFNDRSNKIFYQSITELINGNKAIERNYEYEWDANSYAYSPRIFDAPHSNSGQLKRGLLKNEKQYAFRNNDFTVFKEKDNRYSFAQNTITSFIFRENFSLSTGYLYNPQDGPIPNISYTFYQNYYGYSKLIETVSKEYIGGQVMETKVNTDYNNLQHLQPTLQKITSPDASINETNYSYAHEKGNQRLINANMIGIPLETEVKENGKVINKSETKFESPIHLLPTSALSFDLQNPAIGSTELTYDQYDPKGNLQQYTTKNGISTTIIWGYNKTQPIAKIEGAKLSDISQSLIDNIVNASDNDALLGTEASEQSLVTALDQFRNNSALLSYQINTYTYDPLIGVKSITPPSGIREIYIYDTANRLKEVKQLDKDASRNPVYKILKEFKYNYKQ